MSKMRALLSLLLVVLLMVPLVGCYDRVELEGMAFVISMGVDKGTNNTIDVTASIAVPRKLAGGAGGGGGGGDDKNPLAAAQPITVRARSIPQALDLLNTTVERRVSLTHLSNFGISEQLAREGFVRYLRPLSRYREFRRTVFMYVVPGSMREEYLKNQPVIEQSVTRFTESVADVGRYTGMTPRQYFHDFFTSMEAPNEDPIAPVVAVNEDVQTQASQVQSGGSSGSGKSNESGGQLQGTKPSFVPGHVNRQGGNALEFIGTAVFRQDQLVTYLDGIETRMMLTIRGDLTRTEMDFPDPTTKGQYISIELKHARSPVVDVNLDTNPVQVHVKQSLEGDFMGGQSATDFTLPENMSKLEASVRQRMESKEKELIAHVLHDYQADPFAIFKHTRSEFTTYQDFQTYDFRKAMKTAQVDVQVDVKLRRVGVQLAPVIPK